MTIHRRGALRWTQGGEQGRTTEDAENYFFVCRETTTNKNISASRTKPFPAPALRTAKVSRWNKCNDLPLIFFPKKPVIQT